MNIAILCFGISSISNAGGTEKVFVEMSNAFSKRGHRVWTIWNDKPGIIPYYPFDATVNQVNLSLGKIKVPQRFKILREINKTFHRNSINKVDQYKTNILCQELVKKIDLDQIDVFICYEFNSVMVANQLSCGKIPVVAMVHNSIDDQIASLTPLQRQEASKATVYQVLMPSFVKQAEKLLTTKVICIPNIVPHVDISHTADLSLKKKKYRILHVGRIEGHQKRQLVLIQCFAKLADQFPQWDIYFYGPVSDKKYKSDIDQFVKTHHLETRIHFEGIKQNIIKELNKGDIFAFPSAYEGFGLALTEAMSVGLPSIGFSYAPAVNELIIDGENGYLASDDDEFTSKLSLLMENQEKRVLFGVNAKKSIIPYHPEAVWSKWEALLQDITNNKKITIL